MKSRILAMAGAIFLATSGFSWAQVQEPGYGYHAMGWGGWGMIFGPLMMIAVIAGIVAAIVLTVRWLGGGSPSAPMATQSVGRAALDILRERFAKGEIDKAEFEERRRVLED